MMRSPIDRTFCDQIDRIPVWVTEQMKRTFDPAFQQYSTIELSATGINLACHKPDH
jgi:hypothetical protein